jgi:hypothetical protein
MIDHYLQSADGRCFPYPSNHRRYPLPFFSGDKAAIQESLAPVQLALLVQDPQEGEPDPLPHLLVLPFLETTMTGGPAAILWW